METTTKVVQHTPGPWEAYNGHDRALGSWAILAPQPVGNRAFKVIARTPDDTAVDMANATLLAAAPALFTACEAIEHAFRVDDDAAAVVAVTLVLEALKMVRGA